MAVSRVARMIGVLGAVTAATLGVSALARAGSGHDRPGASELVDRDPGARVGGNTIVLTGDGGHALGVHDRPNFILSLGSNARIVGGGENDQLGALGRDDTIVTGSGGHELIHGGPHGTIVVGGRGHDLVIANEPDTRIEVNSPGDEVVASGHDDQIVCSGNSFHDVIYDNHSDTVNKGCRKHHDPVRAVATAPNAARPELAHGAAGPVAHAASITGSGTNADPYTATACTAYVDFSGDCAVEFAPRSLTGLWANERVPAYKCPVSDPRLVFPRYLVQENLVPFGTTVPGGVQVNGLGAIGVYIHRPLYVKGDQGYFPVGTDTDSSSATNWTFGTTSYQVILHCTYRQPAGVVNP